ncbi:MAG: amino acid adenylation domain-containing protein, partial [Ktedonobacteraceae bacterium]
MKEEMQSFSGRSVEQRTDRVAGLSQPTDVDGDSESLVYAGNHPLSSILDPQMHKWPETLTDMSLLSTAEQEQLLIKWNDTRAEYPRDCCVHTLFEQSVEQNPDTIALVQGEAHLTYGELDRRANQLAHSLRQLGVGPDTLVGLCLERSVEMVVALLGILKAGGAYLPLDPVYPPARLAFMVQDAQPTVLLTQEKYIQGLPRHKGHLIALDTGWQAISQQPAEKLAMSTTAENLAYVMYTSGSTGKPKGVEIPHRSITRLLFGVDYARLDATRTILHMAPISFDAATFEVWGALLHGARCILLPERIPTPSSIGSLIQNHQVTTVWLTASLFNAIIDESPETLRGIEQLLTGGEALSVVHIRRALAELPGTQLINGYGPTESTTFTCCHPIPNQLSASTRSIPIGHPISNTQVYILDSHLQPVPLGVVGELYIGGEGLARGYLKRAELTAERFVPHPFSEQPGARLYRTGDLVRYRPDGQIEFVGRGDHQVKVRGFRIELGEIEQALLEHPAVGECVVIARENQAGSKQLVSYVVPTRPVDALGDGRQALRAFLREHLPEYMLPAHFVLLDALPLTANGKVDRAALPAPEPHAQTPEQYTAPRTPVEQTLMSIWSQVLRLPQVGIHDNFFALGGDSILGISMIAQARQAGLQMTMKQLYQAPTIAQLSNVITPLAPTESGERPVSQGMLTLTPIQRWLFELHPANPHHWNQAFLFQLPPSLSVPLLEQALHWVFDQHDVFRLRFAQTSRDDWQARYLESTEGILFSILDLRSLPEEVQISSMTELCTAAQASLHIGEGPLARAVLFRLSGPQRYRLLLAIHHLVIDTVSWRVLLEDVTLAYRQLLDHQPLVPLKPSSSFQQWAERLVDYVQTEAMHREYAFWLRQQQYLERPEHALPVDDPSGENTVALLRSVELKLSMEETRVLLRDVPQRYRATIEEVLLTALGLVFHDSFGRSDIVIDLEGHGREELFADVDLSRTVGWFTSKFPVLLELGAQPEPIEALRMTKAIVRQLPQRGIGYGLLRYLHPDPAVRSSLRGRYEPQVSLNYLGQFDQVMGSDALFPLASEPSGFAHGPENQRIHQLYVLAMIVEDQLHISWQYSAQLHRAETIQQLTQCYLTRLRQLIPSPQQTTNDGAFPYIPDDFPLLHISQSSLDHLLHQICRSGRSSELVAISRQVQDLYPLSVMQAGLLFHSQAVPDNGVYLVQVNLLIEGALHVSALIRSWQQLIAAHPILRTSFIGEELLTQVVWRHVSLPLMVIDYSELSTEEQKQQLRAYQQEDRRRGFVEQQAPLLRLTLFRLGPQQLHLLWSFHHAILDAWSITLLLNELFARYEMLAQDQEPMVPANRSYRDYIAWLQQQDQQAAEQFWREELRGIAEPTPLPLKQAHVSSRRMVESTYGKQTVRLSRMVSTLLRTLARELHVTVNTLVQASWAFVLSRYSGQPEVLFGMVVAGRSPELIGAESVVGLCVNTVPVRIPVPRQGMVGDWLRQIHERLAMIQHYDYYPLVQIQGVSEIAPGLPLFDSIFAFENHPVEQMQHERLRVHRFDDEEQTHYPLAAVVLPGEQLELFLSYQEQLIEQETAARMLGLWQEVLEVIGQQSAQQVTDLPLLTAAEREQMLIAWNAIQKADLQEQCVHELFEQQAQRQPDAIAIVQGEAQLSYSELNRRATQLAHRLQREGVGPESLVGVCLERSLDLVVAIVAVLKAGGGYVPMDMSLPQERLRYQLHDAQVAVILTQAPLLEQLAESQRPVLCLDREWPRLAGEEGGQLHSGVQPQNLAYVIYTSGSTGRPKGTMLSHRSLCNLLCWHRQAFDLRANDRTTQLAGLGFDASVWELWPSLAAGASITLLDDPAKLAPEQLAGWLTQQASTVSFVPTPIAEHLLEQAWSTRCALRLLLTGGDRLHRAPQRKLPFQLMNNYGPTESTVVATSGAVAMGEVAGERRPDIGRAISNTQLYVLDEMMRPVPLGVEGELYLGGVQLARGYLNRPELTAERFVPHPFSRQPGARLYRTGDVVRYWSDGRVEFVGRRDFQVKVRGYRIELGEIEQALLEHPAVCEAVVVAQDDRAGGRQLVAYVVPAQQGDERVDWLQALRTFLQERLPEYMVPSHLLVLDSLPLTANGKVDRQALPPPQVDLEQGQARDSLRRQGPIADLLAGIWQELLHVPHVNPHDNFFALGGHSLLAMQVVARVHQQMGLELSVRTLFEAPTLAALAEQVQQQLRAGQRSLLPPLHPYSRTTLPPLSFAQERLWFLEQLEPGRPTYHVPLILRLHSPLDPAALQASLRMLETRHEVLRLRIEEHEGQAVQGLLPVGSSPLLYVDLSGLEPQEREVERRRLARQEAQRPFDLVQGPLWRSRLLRLDAQEWVLLLTMHHIITDGWSAPILLQELGLCYTAYSQGAPAAFPQLPIQYADYALWQREWLQGERLEAELAYWREQLAGLEPLQLPTDHPRPNVQSSHGAHQSLHLSASLQQQLQALSRQEGVTMFMTLLAGWLLVLQRYSGQSDLAVGTPIANRSQAELEELIGFFVNTLVLRCSVGGEASVRDLLAHVRDVTLGAYSHQEVPFEQVVEALQPQRELSRSPLFQVMFTWQAVVPHSIHWEALTLQVEEPELDVAKFDLTLAVEESEQGIEAALEYNTDLFEPATVKRMLAHWQQALEALVQQPDQAVANLPLLTEAEQELLLREWNATERAYPEERCVQALFEQQAERHADAIALVQEEAHLTYGELNRRATELAHCLRQLGVGPEVLVGVCLPRRPQLLIALLAVLKAGGAYVPLDPSYPAERLAFMLEDAQLAVLLSHSGLKEQLPASAVPILWLDEPPQATDDQSEAVTLAQVSVEQLAYVLYTSGSTGRPKGVAITHRSALSLLHWALQTYQREQLAAVLASTSMCFDLSIFELFVPLSCGGSVVLVEHALQLAEVPAAQQVTLLNTVPSVISELLRLQALPASLHTVNLAGEPLSRSLVQQVYQVPTVEQVYNLYGPTEDTTYSTAALLSAQERDRPVIGRPISNTQAYVLDGQLQVVPIGVVGELYLGGAGLARGYLQRPEQTAERFVPDPFSGLQGARLYKTGDLVRYRPDGRLEFVGRSDYQVKVRGYRIELGEIEQVLLQHPVVREGVVVVREDGPDSKQLVAYVVPAQVQEAVDQATVQAFLRERLPDYMLPSHFLTLEALPLTANGKVDRRALPAPEQVGQQIRQQEYIGPRTSIEQRLADIWSQVLRLPQVGIHDNFFALGGDSILSLSLIAQARQAGLQLTVKQLFQAPTIAQLSQLVAPLTPASPAASMEQERASSQGALPLTPIQRRFFEQHLVNPHHWIQAFLLQGPANLAVLLL